MITRQQEIIQKFTRFLLHEKLLKPQSVQAYISEIRKFQDFSKIEIQDIKNYPEFSDRMIAYKEAKSLHSRSIYKMVSMFKVYLDFCSFYNYIGSPNFMSMGHGFEKGKGKTPEFFDWEEDADLIDKIFSYPYLTLRDRCLLLLLRYCGPRISELLGSNKEDLDLNNRWLRIRADASKTEKERFCPWPEDIRPWLSLYLTGMQTNFQFIESSPLFQTKDGRRLTSKGVWQFLNRLGKDLGIKCNPHKWRHTLAAFITDKAGIGKAAEILGHESISTTRGYCHYKPSKVKKEYDKIMFTA